MSGSSFYSHQCASSTLSGESWQFLRPLQGHVTLLASLQGHLLNFWGPVQGETVGPLVCEARKVVIRGTKMEIFFFSLDPSWCSVPAV